MIFHILRFLISQRAKINHIFSLPGFPIDFVCKLRRGQYSRDPVGTGQEATRFISHACARSAAQLQQTSNTCAHLIKYTCTLFIIQTIIKKVMATCSGGPKRLSFGTLDIHGLAMFRIWIFGARLSNFYSMHAHDLLQSLNEVYN